MITKLHNRNVSSQRVAEILRSARDLMNNNGKHWIKGDEKKELWTKHGEYTTEEEIPYWDEDDDLAWKPTGEYGYCSIGAIIEVAKTEAEVQAAFLELAKEIHPEGIEEGRIDAIDEYGYEYNPVTGEYIKIKGFEPTLEQIMNMVSIKDIITDENDDSNTTWKDVKGWFTNAAAKAARRKA